MVLLGMVTYGSSGEWLGWYRVREGTGEVVGAGHRLTTQYEGQEGSL